MRDFLLFGRLLAFGFGFLWWWLVVGVEKESFLG